MSLELTFLSLILYLDIGPIIECGPWVQGNDELFTGNKMLMHGVTVIWLPSHSDCQRWFPSWQARLSSLEAKPSYLV